MKSTRNIIVGVIAAASLAGLSTSAMAYKAGDVILRVGSATVDPNSGSGYLYADGQQALPGDDLVEVSTDTQMGISVTYMATPNFGFELLAATPFNHELTAEGDLAELGQTVGWDGKIGETTHLPPTLTLQWYPFANSSFQPYIGGGINFTWFYDEELDSSFTDALGSSDSQFSLSNSFGLVGVIGADLLLGDRFLLNVSAMYADINTEALIKETALGDLAVDVDVNPWVYRVNLGYRF
jgi:outer membrane protein